jgi:hypothetical protein
MDILTQSMRDIRRREAMSFSCRGATVNPIWMAEQAKRLAEKAKEVEAHMKGKRRRDDD